MFDGRSARGEESKDEFMIMCNNAHTK